MIRHKGNCGFPYTITLEYHLNTNNVNVSVNKVLGLFYNASSAAIF
jgi:hypothetical protein